MTKTHPYQDAELPIAERVDDLLGRMTLAEKVGQMTQVEKGSIQVGAITELSIGSLLSGGGGYPSEGNTPEEWLKMINHFQKEALESRLGIPMIYGVDAVHGHNNVVGATIFPHNIGLGATRNAALVEKIGRATALEITATGIRWDFAPAVSVPQDIRWGRSYEGYSQDTSIISELAVAYVKGLIGDDKRTEVLPSVKHYLADGAAVWGSSQRIPQSGREEIAKDPTLAQARLGEYMVKVLELGAWQIDQGVSEIDEATLRTVHLPPYLKAIEAGAMNVMVSYSSWGGLKMHAQKYLLTDVLKGEFGFEGFLVTDWEAIDQITQDFYTCVVQSVNAGIDMIMVPFKYHRFIDTLLKAVQNGDVALSRIDDAVRRILWVKFKLGLFEHPYTDVALDTIGCAAHRALARQAVRESAVLLKNDANILPLSKEGGSLFVAGAADDVGLQCGGWTIEWTGRSGPITPGTTILDGIHNLVADEAAVTFSKDGEFDGRANVGLVVVAEEPYAEGMGDRANLHLDEAQVALIRQVREQCDKLVVVLLSGRPLVISEWLDECDAFVAAWLPGTEGDGVADVLFGEHPFTGKLSFHWPASMAQIPLAALDGQEPLWPIGFGLTG